MAHFAKISENTDIVETVIVIGNDDCGGGDYPQSEAIGQDFIANVLGLDGEWIQTSYSGSFRRMFSHVGGKYLRDLDVFVERQPFVSWSLDENLEWQPPIPFPNDGKAYSWDDATYSWIEVYPSIDGPQ